MSGGAEVLVSVGCIYPDSLCWSTWGFYGKIFEYCLNAYINWPFWGRQTSVMVNVDCNCCTHDFNKWFAFRGNFKQWSIEKVNSKDNWWVARVCFNGRLTINLIVYWKFHLLWEIRPIKKANISYFVSEGHPLMEEYFPEYTQLMVIRQNWNKSQDFPSTALSLR